MELDIMEQVRAGLPVPFEIAGVAFALRQPRPAERDRLNAVETLAYDQTLASYRAAGLGAEPVSDSSMAVRRAMLEALEQDYQDANAANDGPAARQAAQDMQDIEANWPNSLAEERAREATRRASGRWIVDNMLDGDRAEFARLTAPEPLNHMAVMEALDALRRLMTFDPNSAGRRQ
jgi:hypothetical protein